MSTGDLETTSEQEPENISQLPRRTFLRIGAAGVGGLAIAGAGGLGTPYLAQRGLLSADGAVAATSTALGDILFYTEAFPTSPLILEPFRDELNVPKALAPASDFKSWATPPGPGQGQQNSFGNERHQIWPNQVGSVDPLVYKIDLLVRPHAFTTSKVLAIDKNGRATVSFDDAGRPVGAGAKRTLPLSTIYGFNGTFPGPMINAEYGKPVLVRFNNRLDENPLGLDRQDFGSPDWSFLTHLHNGHTAPESDGNPHYCMTYGPKSTGYGPQTFCDNLYLNW